MGFLRRMRGRRRTIASVGTVSIFSTALIAMALNYDGFSKAYVQLNDSGVWVTNVSEQRIGRLNTEVRALDGSLLSSSNDFDILQNDATVLMVDQGKATVTPIDVAAMAEQTPVQLPAGAQIHMGGDLVGIFHPKTGELWAFGKSEIAGFTATGYAPIGQFSPYSAMTVGIDGIVHIADPERRVVSSFAMAEDGAVRRVSEADLGAVGAKDKLAITAVGARAVIFDADTGRVIVPGGKQIPVESADTVRLQQPGPDNSAVLYATDSALVSQPLSGADRSAQSTGLGSGRPAEPVYVAGCAYGVWSDTAAYIRDCPGTQMDESRTVPDTSGSELKFRVNRNRLVLNELNTGGVWLADTDLVKVDDWLDAIPDENDGEESENDTQDSQENIPPDRTQENRPPVANDDDFGVRPGRTTVLPVLDNDTDPDGDLLTAELIGSQPAIGTLQPIYSGSAMQISVPGDASGNAEFTYRADDGRGGQDTAKVSLRVRDWSLNDPPQQNRKAVVVVESGKSADYNVLPDWIDPDGDDIYLAGASTDTSAGDEVRFTSDGVVTFQDGGRSQGKKAVTLVVSDGRAKTEGTVYFDVRAAGGNLPPVANPDHLSAYVNRELVVAPLLNDYDPNGDPLRLVKVSEVSGARITPDFDAGTFTFLARAAGTYYLTYLVTDGPLSSTGLIRIDVSDPGDAHQPPVAVRDTALLPAGGTVMADVLANDYDPGGGVLVVQSVTVPSGSPFTVSVLNHELLKFSELRAFSQPVTIEYQISNGAASAVGQVTVISVPAPSKLQPPRAVDDEVTVRVGDITTIPVLKNDSHPNGAPISLLPQLVEKPAAADGLIFTAQNTVRFKAGAVPKTVSAVYQIIDPQGNKASARIVIHIQAMDANRNSPPRPKNLTVRALAGTTARITVPLDGIDPDGDYVSLIGQDQPPTKGQIVGVGQGWIDYRANEDATGTDTFTYAVQDRLGAKASATVLVGIAPLASMNQPPVAVDDPVVVRPGRNVAVAVMANDSDPDGDPIHLVPGKVSAKGVAGVKVSGDRVLFRSPDKPGDYVISYTIADKYDAEASALILVTVAANAPLLAPIARDDVVSAEQAVTNKVVKVPVLDNDEDPDGSVADLRISVDDPNAAVTSDRKVNVTVGKSLQIIPYTITDVDGLNAKAFIVVPGRDEIPPSLRDRVSALRVKSNESRTIDIGDYVVVASGKRPTLAGKVSAVNGTARAKGSDQVTFTSDKDYVGSAAINMEITDGASGRDSNARRATITVPVIVESADASRPPTFTGASLSIPAGESQRLTLTKYASRPGGGSVSDLKFVIAQQTGSGISATLSGANLEVKVAAGTAKGTSGSIRLTIRDGKNEPVTGTVNVTVIGTSKPLPRAKDDDAGVLQRGHSVVVDALANDFNPLAPQPLRIVSATVESGSGSAAIEGGRVRITAAANAEPGTLVVRYRIADATGDPQRQVDGRIRARIQDRPDAPGVPQVVDAGNGRVVLRWSTPSNNGSPITGYQVRSASGPEFSQDCAANTCTLTGLRNGQNYTFQVAARNALGTSPWSLPSAMVRPDSSPEQPSPPLASGLDSAVAVSWSPPAAGGSAITSYDLEISGSAGSDTLRTGLRGTSYTWTGLINGTSYAFRVRAHNDSGTPSAWSAYSASAVPAGKPATPAAPVVSAVAGQSNCTNVTWQAPQSNGSPITRYLLWYSAPGREAASIIIANAATSYLHCGLTAGTYTYQVQAENAHGRSALSAGATFTLTAVPSAPSARLAMDASGATGKLWITVNAPTDWRGSGARYEYRLNGGGEIRTSWPTDGITTQEIPGVSNGTNYAVEIRACNSLACSAWVSAGSARVYGALRAYTPVATPTGDFVRFSWNLAGALNGQRVSSVHYSIPGGGSGTSTAVTGQIDSPGGAGREWTLNLQLATVEGATASYTVRGTAPSSQMTVRVEAGALLDSSECNSSSIPTMECRQVRLVVAGAQPNADLSASVHTACQFRNADHTSQCIAAFGGQYDPFWQGTIRTDSSGGYVGVIGNYGWSDSAIWAVVAGQRSADTPWR